MRGVNEGLSTRGVNEGLGMRSVSGVLNMRGGVTANALAEIHCYYIPCWSDLVRWVRTNIPDVNGPARLDYKDGQVNIIESIRK